MRPAADRRNPHAPRVSLTKLVDICSTEPGLGPFQGESANVSGRGMSLRASHLPELGEELVCRFEHDSREILVEGQVAWRAETEDGGEFGLKFTALDADSTDVLRELGQRQQPAAEASQPAESDPEEDHVELAAGHRVRLHVDGLAAPMKAAVHTAGERRIRVGSQLEFLKVGRSVELEELGQGSRRAALVDSVNVVLNPATSIPELVVQLKYAGLTPTPAPARTESTSGTKAPTASPADRIAGDEALSEDDESDDEYDDEGPLYPAAEAFGRRLLGWAQSAKSATGVLTTALGQAASKAQDSASALIERGSSYLPERAQSERASTPRRRAQSTRRPTTGAPAHLRSGIHDLGLTGRERKERGPAPPAKDGARRTSGRVLWGAGAVVVLIGSALAFRSIGALRTPDEGSRATAAAKASAPPSQTTPPPNGPVAPATAVPPPPKAAPPTSPDGIVADVPLFGPRALTSTEPAAAPSIDDAAAEKLAAAAAVPDQSWGEDDAETVVVPSASNKTTGPAGAKATQTWGRGRLNLPTIHRIRLDAPGAELAGAVEQEGFVVVVPGRKSMESGKAIQKRDKRILSVAASNTAEGARVRFTFRGAVPAYRVRLRGDFIEFFISAPEDSLAKL